MAWAQDQRIDNPAYIGEWKPRRVRKMLVMRYLKTKCQTGYSNKVHPPWSSSWNWFESLTRVKLFFTQKAQSAREREREREIVWEYCTALCAAEVLVTRKTGMKQANCQPRVLRRRVTVDSVWMGHGPRMSTVMLKTVKNTSDILLQSFCMRMWWNHFKTVKRPTFPRIHQYSWYIYCRGRMQNTANMKVLDDLGQS